MASTSVSSGSSFPVPVDTPQSDWSLQLSQLLSALGQNQYNWAMDQFNQGNALTDQAVNNYLNLSGQGAGLADNILRQYNDVISPLLNDYVQKAASYNSEGRQRFEMGRAESTVAQANTAARDAAERSLQGFGINPNSGRYQDLLLTSRIQDAAARAGAGTQAGLDTAATGRGMQEKALAMGQNLPGMGVNALNSAYQGLAGAVNSKLGVLNTGAGLVNSATPFFNAAGSANKLPPVGSVSGQQANSQSSDAGGGAKNSGDKSGDKGNQGTANPDGITQYGGGGNGTTRIPGRETKDNNPTPSPGGSPGGGGDYSNALMAAGLPDWFSGVSPLANQFANPSDPNAAPNWGSTEFNDKAPQLDSTNTTANTGWGANSIGYQPPDMGVDPWAGVDPNQTYQYSKSGLSGVPNPGNAPTGYDPSQFSQGSGGDTSYGGNYNYDTYTGDGGGGDSSYGGNYNYDTSTDTGYDQSFDGDPSNSSYGGNYNYDTSSSDGSDYGGNYNYDTSSGDGGGGGDSSYGGNYNYDTSSSDGSDYGGNYNYDTSEGYARGGGVIRQPTSGGQVPPGASPTRGRRTDDVQARLNVGEFVIPKDIVAHKGQEFFQKLIANSRKARMGVSGPPARPTMKPALRGAPSFVSRPVR